MKRAHWSGLGALFTIILIAAVPLASPVADASRDGDVEAVRTLLRDGADVNAAQGDGMSALHWAAERGDLVLMDVLLYAGAELEASTRIGQYRPIHLAARNGNIGAVERLIGAGADIAAVTDPSGSTPLHLAALSGNGDVIRALVASGADIEARESEWKQTPLIFAASWNRLDAVVALLESGADPNGAAESMDLERMGRLDAEANRRQQDVLKAFTNDGSWAPTSGQVQAAVLASRGAYEPDAELAERREQSGRFQREVRIKSKGGLTPLLHAARQGHVATIEILLEHGADIDQVGGGDGTSPLLMASINGQFDAVMALLELGADPNIASTLNGATPLFAALNSEWQPRTRYPQPQEREGQEVSYLAVMEALLAAGADADARMTLHPWYMEYTGCGNSQCGLIDMKGATTFLRAAYATDVDAMRLLHTWGADPYIATKAPARRNRRTTQERIRESQVEALDNVEEFEELSDSAQATAVVTIWEELPDTVKAELIEDEVRGDPGEYRQLVLEHAMRQDSVNSEKPDPSGLPPVEEGGPSVFAIHAASGVGYGEGFAGNAHRHAENGWLSSVRFLVEEVGMDVNQRDSNGYNSIHHAAARGDNELILYLVEYGGDVSAISRRAQTTADMANGPVSRVSPIPETVALLESLGSTNSNNCVSCQ